VLRPLPAAETQLFAAPTGNGTAAGSRDAPLARLPEAARQAVRVADLKGQGIDDCGTLNVSGFGGGNPAAVETIAFQPLAVERMGLHADP
jgi:hypothetical protein